MKDIENKRQLNYIINTTLTKLTEEVNDVRIRLTGLEKGLNGTISRTLDKFKEEMIIATTTHSEKIKALNTRVNWIYGLLGSGGFIFGVLTLIKYLAK